MQKFRYYINDIKECIDTFGLYRGLYYSEILSPIYSVLEMPKKTYRYIRNFIYYGKAGARLCEYDANGVDELIYAHIKRVRKFMDSDKTHCMWTEKNKGLIRKLYELEALCKEKVENDLESSYYLEKAIKKYGFGKREKLENGCYVIERSDEQKKAMFIARKKDKLVTRYKKDRYNELLVKYLPLFWD